MLMKKLFYFLAIALVAATACQQKQDPEPTPGPDPGPTPVTPTELVLKTDAIVDLSMESGITTIKFTTNAAWKASVLGAPDGAVVLGATSGAAGEDIELKVTYQNLPAGELGRIFEVELKADDKTAKVEFFQGFVFLTFNEEATLGVAGGKAEYTIYTNVDYTFKKYDGPDEAFPFAPVTITEGDHFVKVLFDVAANPGYDSRYAYVKFTVSDIQVDVYDEETGEPTGETEDAVYRYYVFQEGYSNIEWKTLLSEDFYVGDGATASVAMFGDKLLVCDGTAVHTVNPATGIFEGTLNTGDLPVQCISNDDAGNVLFANLGVQDNLYEVYAVKAGAAFDASKAVHLIHFVNDAWSGSTGIDKVAAKGDVFGDGIVTAMYGGVMSYGGLSYCLYWTISGGKAAESFYNEWNPVVNNPDQGWTLTTPALADDIWVSNRAVFVARGASASDGFFYGGYDGLYNVNYYNGSDWSIAIEGAGDWAGGPQGMHVTTWNGKKILVVAQMGYVWFSEGWGMPAYLWVVDVTDPANAVVLSITEFHNGLEQNISGDTENSSVDVLPVVDGNDLVVYYVDTSHGHLVKVKYPKL